MFLWHDFCIFAVVMTKIEKAKKILLDNGFFSKYHYILDVMNSNRKTKVVRCETRGIIWACQVLKQNLNLLKRKYPRYASEFDSVYEPYYNELRNIHDSVLDDIFNNCYDGNKQEETNDSN